MKMQTEMKMSLAVMTTIAAIAFWRIEFPPAPTDMDICDTLPICKSQLHNLTERKKMIWWENWQYLYGHTSRPTELDDAISACRNYCASQITDLDDQIEQLLKQYTKS